MNNNKYTKKWENGMGKLNEGDKNFLLYLTKGNDIGLSVGKKSVEPHTLIIFSQVGDKKLIRGSYNQQPIEPHDEDDENEPSIMIIVDTSDKDKIEILVNSEEIKTVYNEKFKGEDKHYKLVIFQENKYFTDVITYDSEIGKSPVRISTTEERSRNKLKRCILSLVSSLENKIHQAIKKDEEDKE